MPDCTLFYPENIYYDLATKHGTDTRFLRENGGIEEIYPFLSPIQNDLICLYYKDGKTYKQICQDKKMSFDQIKRFFFECLKRINIIASAKKEYLRKYYSYKRMLKNPANYDLSFLSLSTKAYNCLIKNNVLNLDDVLHLQNQDLKNMNGCGKKIKKEIENAREDFCKKYNFRIEDYTKSETVWLVPPRDEVLNDSIEEDPIENLDLSVRTYNALVRRGVKTIQQAAKLREGDYSQIRNFGVKAATNLKEALHKYYSATAAADTAEGTRGNVNES